MGYLQGEMMDLTEQELVQLKTIDNDLVASGGGK